MKGRKQGYNWESALGQVQAKYLVKKGISTLNLSYKSIFLWDTVVF